MVDSSSITNRFEVPWSPGNLDGVKLRQFRAHHVPSVIVKHTIWYVSKYASTPGSVSGQRGISLAMQFNQLGHEAVVIGSKSNHASSPSCGVWTRVGRRFEAAHFGGVMMLLHRTFPYRKTVSLARVISWIDFEWGLLRLDSRNLPRPSHIIVSSLSLLTVLSGHRLAKKFGAKLIVEIRDIWPLNLEAEWNLSPRNVLVAALRKIEIFGYRKASVVVGTMPNLTEHINDDYALGVRVEHVGLGIDSVLADNTKAFIAPPKSPTMTVGYAGSIGLTNSLDNFLAVAAEIGPESNVRFELWGDGDLLPTLRQQFKNHNHIHFHGRVGRDELYSKLVGVDVFFLATNTSPVWKFGQSLHKVVEYMALGRPVIAEYSGHKSMINEARCGIFVNPGDSVGLRNAIENFRDLAPSRREQIGKRGRRWIRANHSYGSLARRYLEIIEQA